MQYFNSINRAIAHWCQNPVAWRTYIRIEMMKPTISKTKKKERRKPDASTNSN